MIKILLYNMGNWIENGYEMEDTKDYEEYGDYLERIGYYTPGKIYGDEFDEHFHTYEHNENDTRCCLFNTSISWYPFIILNTCSYIIFKKEFPFLFERNFPEFVRDKYGDFWNRNKIQKLYSCTNKTSHHVYGIIDGHEDIIVFEETNYRIDEKTGKPIKHRHAINWIRENFKINE